jgi:hypothetical protein
VRTIATYLGLLAVLAAALPGCATTESTLGGHQGAAIGAGAGAVGGAVIGGLVGGKKGAVAGGLLGALAGGLIGNYHDEKEKTLAETRRAHAEYSPAKGTRLRIEKVTAGPASVRPGGTVNIDVTYAVLTPAEGTLVPVREIREILFGGSKVGEVTLTIEREGGTWRSVVPVTLPADARPGNYRVLASVEYGGGGKDLKETSFRIQP